MDSGLEVTYDQQVADFRIELVRWIGQHVDELRPRYLDHGTTTEILDHQRTVQRRLFDEGFMRKGWPQSVGGLGGSPLQRAVLGEELTGRGLVHSSAFSMTEVLGPAVAAFAEPELAAEVVPAMLCGDEFWCQGFSEPEAGSDLGSMRTSARSEGGDWVITGQKLWTSWAHHASRCIVLARTGTAESGSRGITAFFVDMDSPGITVRPLETMAGVDEFCETFFDEVRVPTNRILGEIGGGWAVAQHVLGCERGPIFWQRSAWLLHHLSLLCQQVAPGDREAERAIGEAFADVFTLRAQSRGTQYRMVEGDLPGAEASIDKILIAAADQAVFSAAQQILPGVIEFDDSSMADRWRKEWLYSRAATIYGGTSEIQRDIVSGRLLGLVRVP
jgi:alkylation response protein AidB-like acyl-CoA dehydrogenase